MIYLLFLLLLWPATGWAGETTIAEDNKWRSNWGHIMCQYEDGRWFPARPNGVCYSQDATPNPCLATMEAAERAIEPFISYHKLRDQEFDKAMKLWAEAKRCWKEQP